MEAVWSDSRLDISRVRPKAAVVTGYTRFQDGDVLLPKITPTFEAGRSVLISGLRNGVGAGTTELHVLRPTASMDPRFLTYLTQSQPFLKLGEAEMYGVAGQQRVPDDFVRDFVVNLPSMEEQRRIADFLDRGNGPLRRAMDDLTRLRELLKERRWSLFQTLIDGVSAPVGPLRRVLRSITDGPFGSAFSSSDYSDHGAAVVRLGNIGFAEYRYRDQAHIPLSLYRNFMRHKVDGGSILIAGLGDTRNHAGRACVAPDLGLAIVKGKCFCARAELAVADPEFIAFLLSSPIGRDSMESRGSTRSMINLELVKSALVPIPSLGDQRRIAGAMNSADDVSRSVEYQLAQQCELLLERRQALITAAVTGQIDVTTAGGVG
jgi:type I restriction enzyme S subunit